MREKGRVTAYRKSFLLSLLSLAVAQAWGQASPPRPTTTDDAGSPAQLGTVVITGRALSIKKAIAEKRAESVISDGISSDEIGSIPDFGLGEALQRVPGVSMIVNNARGEAQFMTVRGFQPDYNSVTIDGIALPATENLRRIVSLDVIPSSLAGKVSVYKSFTPEMEGNAVGGLTNLSTRSAMDKVGFHANVRADLTEWENHRRIFGKSPSGQAEATVSNTFGEQNQFGLLLSGSYFRRVSSSLNTAIDSYSYFRSAGAQTNAAKLNPATDDLTHAIPFADRLRWLTYDNIRERKGLFGKFDYDNADNFKGYVSAGGFQHLNNEDRRAQWLQNATTPATSAVTANASSGSTASGQSQTDYAKFDQNRQLKYLQAGAEYSITPIDTIEVTINSALASYRQDAKLYTFAIGNAATLGYSYTLDAGAVPIFTPTSAAAPYNPSSYSQIENTTQLDTSTTRQKTIKLNYTHNQQEGARGLGFKIGGQIRDLKKVYNFNENRYNPATGQTITLAQVGASDVQVVPYNANGKPLLLVDPAKAQAYFEANSARYVQASTNTARSTQSDFDVAERIDASYAMATYQLADFQLTGGARVERTKTTIGTYLPSPLNQSTVFSRVAQDATRTDVLPSLNASWDVSQDLRLRAGLGKSLARAVYTDLAQSGVAVVGNIINVTQANPDLQPRKSRNLDASVEWYASKDSLLSVALFNKNISNEIARLTSTSTVAIGGAPFTLNTTQAVNTGTAKTSGLELAVSDVKFDFLPAPLNTFGGTANLAVMRQKPASIRMANGTVRDMPGLQDSTKSTANIALLWGWGPWSSQIAYNYTGKTLTTVSTNSAAQDVYFAGRGSVDAQLRYQVNKDLTVLLQGKNLGNTPFKRITGPNAGLLNQEIDNGRSYWIGVTYAL